MTQKKIDRIKLSYFGTASPEWYDIQYDWLPSYVLKRPKDQKGIDLPIKGKIAISATNLQGVYLRHDYFGWIKRHKPIDKIGYSIFIYDIK